VVRQVVGIGARILLIDGAAVFAVLLVLIGKNILRPSSRVIVLLAIGQGICTVAEPFRALVESWRRPKRCSPRREAAVVGILGSLYGFRRVP